MRQSSMFKALSDNKTHLTLNIKPSDPMAGWFTKFMCRMFANYEKYVLKRLSRMIEDNYVQI